LTGSPPTTSASQVRRDMIRFRRRQHLLVDERRFSSRSCWGVGVRQAGPARPGQQHNGTTDTWRDVTSKLIERATPSSLDRDGALNRQSLVARSSRNLVSSSPQIYCMPPPQFLCSFFRFDLWHVYAYTCTLCLYAIIITPPRGIVIGHVCLLVSLFVSSLTWRRK